MIHSMTGYGYAYQEESAFSVTAEIKSVNHRFLDISTYLPQGFRSLEGDIEQIVKQYIQRGKLDVTLTIHTASDPSKQVAVDWPLLQQYVAATADIQTEYAIKGSLELRDLLQIPGLFTMTQQTSADPEIQTAVNAVLHQACRDLTVMRRQEGTYLAKDLRARMNHLSTAITHLLEVVPEAVQTHKQRFTDRMNDILGTDTSLDEQVIMNEMAVYMDKTNIEEELTRLQSHVEQFQDYMSSDEQKIGKKLNFLQQEMNREMNTIGAKGNDFAISIEVVEMKDALESVREQIQNIE